jgi:hypothetical protein
MRWQVEKERLSSAASIELEREGHLHADFLALCDAVELPHGVFRGPVENGRG